MSKKVLLVEDNQSMHDLWRRMLVGYEIELISAFTIEEAKKQFNDNPDIEAIVMDACVPGSRPTTLRLVREFRRTFEGPMIAVSNLKSYRRKLIHAGCDYQSEKESLHLKLLEILGL